MMQLPPSFQGHTSLVGLEAFSLAAEALAGPPSSLLPVDLTCEDLRPCLPNLPQASMPLVGRAHGRGGGGAHGRLWRGRRQQRRRWQPMASLRALTCPELRGRLLRLPFGLVLLLWWPNPQRRSFACFKRHTGHG